MCLSGTKKKNNLLAIFVENLYLRKFLKPAALFLTSTYGETKSTENKYERYDIMKSERMHFVEYFTPDSRLRADRYADRIRNKLPGEAHRLNLIRNKYLLAMSKKNPPFSREEALDYLRKWNEQAHKPKSRKT